MIGALPCADRLVVYSTQSEWHADNGVGAPRFSLGATSLAKLLGKSPWSDAHSLQEAHRGRARPPASNSAMLAGIHFEKPVLTWAASQRGQTVFHPLCRVVHPRYPWFRPSPDGFLKELGEWGGAEVKCPRFVSDDEWAPDGTVLDSWQPGCEELVPVHYALQVYGLLAASELPWWDLIVAEGIGRQRVIRIMADPETQDAMMEAADLWRQAHLVEGRDLPFEATDGFAAAQARRPRDGEREATSEEVALMRAYQMYGNSRRASAEQEMEIKCLLLDKAGDHRKLTFTLPDVEGSMTVGSDGRLHIRGL